MYSGHAITEIGTTNGSALTLEAFPSEDPSLKEVETWLDAQHSTLTRTGYGPAMRDEDPASLIPLVLLVAQPDPTPLSAAEKTAAGPLEALRHDILCEKSTREKKSAQLTLDAGRCEYQNKLAALITAAMRRTAGLRLRALLDKHKHPTKSECWNGGGMWRELSELRKATSRLDDVRAHDRAVEAARDVSLPDGFSANDFMTKVNNLMRDHIPWLERPMTGVALGNYIVVRLMPRCNAPEGRQIVRELSATGAAKTLSHTSYVIDIRALRGSGPR